MTRKFWMVSVAILVFLVATALVAFPQARERGPLLPDPDAKEQWEYTVLPLSDGIRDDLVRTLNNQGRRGWEFTATVRQGGRDLAVFKRLKT